MGLTPRVNMEEIVRRLIKDNGRITPENAAKDLAGCTYNHYGAPFGNAFCFHHEQPNNNQLISNL